MRSNHNVEGAGRCKLSLGCDMTEYPFGHSIVCPKLDGFTLVREGQITIKSHHLATKLSKPIEWSVSSVARVKR